MGQRRDRLDGRRARQTATRKKNAVRKTKERLRRAARLEAKAGADSGASQKVKA